MIYTKKIEWTERQELYHGELVMTFLCIRHLENGYLNLNQNWLQNNEYLMIPIYLIKVLKQSKNVKVKI